MRLSLYVDDVVFGAAFEQTVAGVVKRRHLAFAHGCQAPSAVVAAETRYPLCANWSCRSVVVIELVEVAHRLHDRFEVRTRIERVEQLRGVGQQRVGSLDRGPHIVLRRIREAAVSGQQEFGVEPLDAFQRLDVVGDAARAEHATHDAAGHQGVGGEQQALVLVEQRDAGRGVAGRVHTLRRKLPRSSRLPSSKMTSSTPYSLMHFSMAMARPVPSG